MYVYFVGEMYRDQSVNRAYKNWIAEFLYQLSREGYSGDSRRDRAERGG